MCKWLRLSPTSGQHDLRDVGSHIIIQLGKYTSRPQMDCRREFDTDVCSARLKLDQPSSCQWYSDVRTMDHLVKLMTFPSNVNMETNMETKH